MSSVDPVQQFFGTVYAAPMRPELWHVALEQLCALTGITKAALITHNIPKNDHRILAIRGDRLKENIPAYEEFYYQHDEWTLRFPRQHLAGRVVRGEELWPVDSLYKSAYYNEFLRSLGICQMAGIASDNTSGAFDSFSVYRGPLDDEFSLDVCAILKMLAPHLQTALTMRRMLATLESRVSDLENALDLVTVGLVLLDAKGHCVLANRAAKSILDLRNGLYLDRATLCATVSAESAKLHQLICSATLVSQTAHHPIGSAMLISRDKAKPLQILTAPLREDSTAKSGKAVAIVFISDPEQKTVAPSEVLRVLFGLTSAEARLSVSLLDGNSLTEVAEMHCVCQETVRSQLKNVFQKTGTRRQGELIRLLARVSFPNR